MFEDLRSRNFSKKELKAARGAKIKDLSKTLQIDQSRLLTWFYNQEKKRNRAAVKKEEKEVELVEGRRLVEDRCYVPMLPATEIATSPAVAVKPPSPQLQPQPQPQPQPQNITSLEPCKTITKPAQITRSFLEELCNLNYKTYRVAVEKAAWALQDQNTSVLI